MTQERDVMHQGWSGGGGAMQPAIPKFELCWRLLSTCQDGELHWCKSVYKKTLLGKTIGYFTKEEYTVYKLELGIK